MEGIAIKINEIALSRKETLEVNKIIDRIWGSLETEWVDNKETFITNTWGGECVDMVVGGEDWHVHQMRPGSKRELIWINGKEIEIASNELMEKVINWVPYEERISVMQAKADQRFREVFGCDPWEV